MLRGSGFCRTDFGSRAPILVDKYFRGDRMLKSTKEKTSLSIGRIEEEPENLKKVVYLQET